MATTLKLFLQVLTQHDGVDDEPHDVLHDEDGDGGGTLLRDHAAAEADGHLDLDGEQEGRGERPEGGPGKERILGFSFLFCFVWFWSNNVFPFFPTQHLT